MNVCVYIAFACDRLTRSSWSLEGLSEVFTNEAASVPMHVDARAAAPCMAYGLIRVLYIRADTSGPFSSAL